MSITAKYLVQSHRLVTSSHNSSHRVSVPTPTVPPAHSLNDQVYNILRECVSEICGKSGSDMHTGIKRRLTSFIKLATCPCLACGMLREITNNAFINKPKPQPSTRSEIFYFKGC